MFNQRQRSSSSSSSSQEQTNVDQNSLKYGAPEKRLGVATAGNLSFGSVATMVHGNPFASGTAGASGVSIGMSQSNGGYDSRFSQYKLTPQATSGGMVSLGAVKQTRNDMIQAQVMKHESVTTGKIPLEEQKKYKNLR